MKFSIIIPTYNLCTKLLVPCITSIIEYTDLSDTEIIVVANGCTDETREYVTGLSDIHPTIKLLWFDSAIGYTRATNEGIKIASGEYFILLNNDVLLQPQSKNQWIKSLIKPFLTQENVGITGPMKEICTYANKEFILFFCAMVSRELIDKIGLLDECFSPGYGEDVDMACRAILNGFKIIQVPDNNSRDFYDTNKRTGSFPLYHEGNVTFKNWVGGEQLLERNNNILRERYNKPRGLDGDGSNRGATGLSGLDYRANIERALKCDGFMSDEELLWLSKMSNGKKVIIEIGSWHGKSTLSFLSSSCEKVYAIDHWMGSVAERDSHHSSAKMLNGDHAYLEFLSNTIDYISNGRLIPVRLDTKNASDFFIKQGIKADAVFIDAGHTEEEVRNDILNWLPVVKENGIICGHDYGTPHWPGVTQAVNSLFSNVKHIPNTSIWSHVTTKEDFKSNIYDCFPFNSELDLLDKRFETLFNIVDRFVIVEADRTHGNKPKPYYFKENLKRFEKYLSKVSHVIISDYPAFDRWSIERHQRDCIMRALGDCKDDDTIIISDLDEIPNPEAIKEYNIGDGIKSFEMDLFYYNTNVKAKDKWKEAKILPYYLLKKLTPCGARYKKCTVIPDGGNHFSYFGGIESIKKKIEDSAHQELNKDEFKDIERIKHSIENGIDLFGRDIQFEIVNEEHPL